MLIDKYRNLKRKVKETVLKKTFRKWSYLKHNDTFILANTSNLKVTTSPTQWGYSVELFPPESMTNREVILQFKVHEGEIGISVCDPFGGFKNENCYSVSKERTHKITLFPNKDNSNSILIRNTYYLGASKFEIETIELGSELSKIEEQDILSIKNEKLTFNEAVNWSLFYSNTFNMTRLRGARQNLASNLQRQFQFKVNNLKINHHMNDESCRAFFISGFYEPIESLAIRNLLDDNSIFLDIGANQGFHTLQVSQHNPKVKVHAFEPSSREFNRLNDNITNNNFTNIQSHKLALGDTETQKILKVGEATHSGHNTLCQDFIYHTTQKEYDESVNVISLDHFSKLYDLNGLSLIKLDVEGFENKVFEGARTVLHKLKPNILFELAKSRFSDPTFFYSCGQQLIGLGYSFYIFDNFKFEWVAIDYGSINDATSIIASCENKDIFLKRINKNYQEFFTPSAVEPTKAHINATSGASIFLYDSALAINEARLEHLASFNINFSNKHVLEVGGGIGLHTPFFLSQGAKVHFTDARIDNLEIAKKNLGNLVTYELLDLNNPPESLKFSQFDYIYCYGTLYHLSKPEVALRFLSKFSSDKLFLETCISYEDNSKVNIVNEDISSNNQAFDGIGCRPSQTWILKLLKELWGNAYESFTTPNHADFPETTNIFISTGNTRSIFVASKLEICSDYLKPHAIYKKQKYKTKSFLLSEEDYNKVDLTNLDCQKIHLIFDVTLSIQDIILKAIQNNFIVLSYQISSSGTVLKALIQK